MNLIEVTIALVTMAAGIAGGVVAPAGWLATIAGLLAGAALGFALIVATWMLLFCIVLRHENGQLSWKESLFGRADRGRPPEADPSGDGSK
ncbi:MAG: hypothetical protein OXU20_39415 [Myxococcales bacterium]|nr:hypothetical protein [Myxococcales bacterium]